ncbi:DUF916 domain-containing protein [Candidatus Saccharibacteria bacterium]|nr:DUF916 domain-containing protein [Candidatus Saccharibacteria bacterium]
MTNLKISRITTLAAALTTAALLTIGLARPLAAADSNVSISISPSTQRLTLDPGQTQTAEITVINSGDTPYQVRVYAAPYQVAPDYSRNIFDDPATAHSQIYRWISFANQSDSLDEAASFTLAPNARRTIEFTITIPASVPAGGQYAGIMAEVIPPADASGVVAVRRVASLLYANINGNTIERGTVIERTWQGRYQSRNVNTSLIIENSGNTDFDAESRLLITNFFGKTVGEITEPAKLIFPGTSRRFELNWQSKGPFGIYKLTQQSRFLGQTVEESKWVFVAPTALFIFTVLILALAIFAAAIAGLARKRRRKVRKQEP